VLFLQVGHQHFVRKHKGKVCVRDTERPKSWLVGITFVY